MVHLDDTVQKWFLECGWTCQHSAKVPDTIPVLHPAHEILRTFGGIKLLENDCDDDDPYEKFEFRLIPDPDSAIQAWSRRLRSQLVGIANEDGCHAELYVDGTGRCFSNSLVHGAFAFAGDSLGDTLLGVLNHRRYRPLLRPWQNEISMYGEWIVRGDPRVYDYGAKWYWF